MEGFIDLFHQYGRRLATLASIVLVVLMGVSVADTVLFFYNNLDTDTVPGVGTGPIRPGHRGDTADLAQLNLFGSAQATGATVDAPETSLNLELQGVFNAANPKNSTAIVAEAGKDGKLYGIGDHLPGNVVLDAVFDDHILIKRGGRLEKLMFPKDTDSTQQFGSQSSFSNMQPVNMATSQSSLTADRIRAIRQRIAERNRNMLGYPSQSPGATIRDYVKQFHKQIESNPQQVLNNLGVSPVSDGQPDGYRIGNNVPQQALAQAGLQQGDIILSVNGRPVGNVATDTSLVNQVLAAGRARVEVQRGERKFFLTVPIPGGH